MGPRYDRNIWVRTSCTSLELCSLLTSSTNNGKNCVTYLLNDSLSRLVRVLREDTSNDVLADSSSFFAELMGRIQRATTGRDPDLVWGPGVSLAQLRYVWRTSTHTETRWDSTVNSSQESGRLFSR
ncbi:hypothetical protein MLD38_023081 [Melastoma candidum]|uniref:Uncharacterized protein n=1 Tax=Melastoma candidum TaxID=119954 RepID=A0ACB9QN73_9MYRT|nr:hypothetical protein MLD38_023081 [Melastoma candidum]